MYKPMGCFSGFIINIAGKSKKKHRFWWSFQPGARTAVLMWVLFIPGRPGRSRKIQRPGKPRVPHRQIPWFRFGNGPMAPAWPPILPESQR